MEGLILNIFSVAVENIFMYFNIETDKGSCCFDAVGSTILQITIAARGKISVHSPYRADRDGSEEYKSRRIGTMSEFRNRT